MRGIRVWYKKESRWFSPDEFKINADGSISTYGIYCIQADLVRCDSTGLKDENGKEIYEGDILRIFDENYEVRIITTECKLYVDYGYPDKHSGLCDSWSEIIGNIYEHRDLLGR